MKTIYLSIIFATIVLSFSACKKVETTLQKVETCSLTNIIFDNGSTYANITCDSVGNISTYSFLTLVKNGDSLLFKYFGNNTYGYVLYDKLNRPIKYDSKSGAAINISYNNSLEQPEKIIFIDKFDTSEITMLLTYIDNNVSQINYTSPDGTINLNVDYYPNQTNPLAPNLKLLGSVFRTFGMDPMNFALLFSKNLAKSMSSIMGVEANYTYTFDGNKLTKEKINFLGQDSMVTNYVYTCN